MAFDSATPINRRTVAKGIAWSVPAVAVAGAVPAFAVSPPPPPPPPEFDWSLGCATVGNTKDGCANLAKTPQVPFTITNNTGQTLQFQILGQKSWIGSDPEPLTFTAPGGIYTNTGVESPCTPEVGITGCGGYESVVVTSGQTLNLWLVGSEMSASSAFFMKIKYRWIQAAPCGAVVGPAETIAEPDAIIPSNNCD